MNEIYEKYYNPIYFWALKKLNNKEDAEDLTNQVFLIVFEYFNKNIKVAKVENLIWKIAYNLWCSMIKKKNNNATLIFDYNLIRYEEKIIEKIIYQEIMDNLNTNFLTEKELKAFKFYYCYDLSIKEIAVKLNTSMANVKYYLYNARKKIRERYNE